MIEYLKIEIIPYRFAGTDVRQFRIQVKDSCKPEFQREQICEPDDLVSFFDLIWDCAKQEVLKAITAEVSSTVPAGASQRP